MLALSTFPIEPPLHGGALRQRAILRHLGRTLDVTAITVADGDRGYDRAVAPGLREISIPLRAEHRAALTEASREPRIPVDDILFARLAALTPEIGAALDVHAARADLLFASQPYPAELLADRSSAPLWLSCHNAEWRMKRAMLAGTHAGSALATEVRRLEREAIGRADLLTVVSAADARALCEDHGADPARIVVVANGVDCREIEFTPAARRWPRGAPDRARPLRALVLSSAHPPNVEGLRAAAAVLAEVPDVHLTIAGSAALAVSDLATTMTLMHPLDTPSKALALASFDVGLNPSRDGGGMQHKVAEYLAAGLPTISTAFGLRGFTARPGVEVQIAEIDELPGALSRFRELPPERLDAITRAGRAHAETRLHWPVLLSAIDREDASAAFRG